MEDMKNKTAIITGATSGIGRATAILLAHHGVKVALAGRDAKRGQELEKEIVSLGSDAFFIKTDVSKAESVRNLIQSAKKKFGEIHYALNNAGIEGALGSLVDMQEDDFDDVISTNLKGVWLCLKHELETMTEGSSIVNISTNITRMGMPGTGAYTASKAGVESLTKVAAIEHGKKGVRINAISPGAVDTPMIHRIYPGEEDFKNISEQNPLGRIAYPEDIANTVLWLFSPMSAHVNGNIIFVDGGSSLV
ncbi:MAG: short chain dehydrogenase [Chlamydiae bacterium CG10_big_fil_rev_8_21_14_0_10_35_9]|nr:MAG: short chain dehydrogenase [Chlamydiae bacterium CG10_big_fil_rev_8_21_14_0_10_35_9]